jgi:hypothetical protein
MKTNIFIDVDSFVDSVNSPEKTLFLTVILQALLDASKPSTTNESERAKVDRERGRAWFNATVGVTAEDFVIICDMAGVDPAYTREFAHKVLTSKEVDYVRKKINTILSS